MKSFLPSLLLLVIAMAFCVKARYSSFNRQHSMPYNDGVNREEAFRRVCYLRMDPKTKFDTSLIDGNLCTHIIYAFCRIDSTGHIVLGSSSDRQYMEDIEHLKSNNPHLKLLVSIYNEEEFQGFNNVAGNEILTSRLAQSAISFMKKYSFDGLDLDWEFPSFPRRNETERRGYTDIIKQLRRAFGEKYLLTVAVPAQERVFKSGYELIEIARQVDWLNVMTYDYYIWTTLITGPNAPLYSLSETKYVPIAKHLSVDWTIQEFITMGVPRHKIVMGIPTYSRGYKLLLSSGPKPLQPSTGAHSDELPDYLTFSEVCKFFSLAETQVHYDTYAEVPYLSTKSIWVSYEDERSLTAKVKYAISNHLGGYMTWNLNSDNFNQPCMGNQTKNILHKTMLQTLKNHDLV